MRVAPDPVPISPGEVLACIKDLPHQLQEALTLGTDIVIRDPIDRIIVAGVGGSGSSGDVLSSILWDEPTPLHTVKAMTLPGFAGQKTAVFIVSYSGDSAESIAMYNDATKKKCKIIVISSGGRISHMARQDGLAHVMLPRGLLSRFSYGYITFCILGILSRSKLCGNILDSFESLHSLLEKTPYEDNAKTLAKRLATAIPLITTTPRFEGVAKRWTLTLSEHAKIHAFYHTIPEACHNAICGFQSMKHPFHVILLHEDRELPSQRRQIESFKQTIRHYGAPVMDIELKGISTLSKVMSACHLGDLVGYHLAEALGADPLSTAASDEYHSMLKKAESPGRTLL